MYDKNKYIITRLSWGVGNQLFQYAVGKNLAKKNNAELLLDISWFKNNNTGGTEWGFVIPKFNVLAKIMDTTDTKNLGLPNMEDTSFLGKAKRKTFRLAEYYKPLHKKKIILEPCSRFCPEISKIKNSCYLSGVWQSEKYFEDIKDIIKKELTLRNRPTKETEVWIKKIAGCNSVSLHIRRGDYVSNPIINQKHGVCDLDYYKKAIKIISEKEKDTIFFIFSNDIKWAKDNLKLDRPVYFVSNKIIPDYEELIIMSKCKHNIIANSSFSWWGAWLNNNPEKIVIAPQKWFNVSIDTSDLIPNDWTRI